MVNAAGQPPVREFFVYKGTALVLSVRDEPGVLRSTAPLPPGRSLAAHPFLHAQAHDAATEHELRQLLLASVSFDGYLQKLVAAGYDIAAEKRYGMGSGYRIYDKNSLLGVCWDASGQFTTLTQQPERRELVFDHVLVTAYDDERADELLSHVRTTNTYSGFLEETRKAGHRLEPV